MIPRYVKSQINEQVYLPLAAVHALRLRLSNNTKFYLVKVVSTLVQILVCQFDESLHLGYINDTYGSDRGRPGRIAAILPT